MAEQTFKSPGFFEREIEVIKRPIVKNDSVPVGLVGPSVRGPAFVPTTVYSREEFIRIFGAPSRRLLSGHAAAEFFRNDGKALTFCRTLGSGVFNSSTDKSAGAGFKLTHTYDTPGNDTTPALGAVRFIAAEHTVTNAEFLSLGMFSDNDSHTLNADQTNPAAAMTEGKVQLVRAMIFTHKDYAITVGPANNSNDHVDASDSKFVIRFKLTGEIAAGEGISYTVSLDPEASDYIANVLNTDPLSFDDKKHMLYAHFPVDAAVASVDSGRVAVLQGDSTYAPKFGNFSSRFVAPKTPKFISQPFGKKEYDLFHFESLDDGAYANENYKISISNLNASTDPTNDFGTFTVTIRDLKDTDESPIVYESFTQCSLDPNATNFIARVIGDQKVFYNLDTTNLDERRLFREGSFRNVSTRVRVVMSDDVLKGEVPSTALPFGYRGVPALLLNSDGTDSTGGNTLFTKGRSVGSQDLDHSVLPPLPYRFKITKGDIRDGTSYNQTFTGEASALEAVSFDLHWGLMPTRVKEINNPNSGTVFNELLTNYTKFLGADVDVVKTGAIADSHNNNKFSLAKVALSKYHLSDVKGTISDVFKDAIYARSADVGTSKYDSSLHYIDMSAASIDPLTDDNQSAGAIAANAVTIGQQYIVTNIGDGTARLTSIGAGSSPAVGDIFIATSVSSSGGTERVKEYREKRASLAKLLSEDVVKFNKYSLVAKFTAPFYGGFDGLNILDSDSYFMTDKAASTETGGKATSSGFTSGLAGTSNAVMQGSEDANNVIASFKNAIRLMTDDLVVNHNVLVVPNVRDPFVTDFAKRRVEEYGKALYVMDLQQFDSASTRIFVNERGIASGRADVDTTSSKFDTREVNSSYVASYFPDVMVQDSGDDDTAAETSRRSIRVPSSIVALGALAKTDDVSQPWFAPAGFTRGALNTITSLDVRLNAEDRDTLYEARINPIANFPNKQFVIFGQKTSQLARTALDRVNVRRLVLEVKRRIEIIAQGLLFEQNNKATRDNFISNSSRELATIQIGQGIEDFRVIMDETNNSDEDVDNNRLNGKIIIVPTRAIEFIAIDFVITNAGVEFP